MKKILCTLAVALTSAVLLNAQTYDFTLTFEPEGGGGRTGSGGGTLTLDAGASTLTFNDITWEGISSDFTATHIHGPTAPGGNAGVLYGLSPTYMTLNPDNRSGTFSGTLPFVDDPNGSGFTVSEQLDQVLANMWYINIHSDDFGGGEIRGTIELVPEPSTFALLGLGAAGLVCWRFRRRH
ncbi:MAG TPA: CHRD domain-containing protein [Methylomirabilota bacterium]|nr:CHRD domain-containing protein [Methylomirabilota bacterium]